MHIVGIDVSKAKLDVALSADNREYETASFENTPSGHKALEKWCVKQGVEQMHVGLEATGRYGDGVASYLAERGYVVSVINPAQIHAYGKSKLRRNKNDALDARLIADFCFTQQPDPWLPPSETQRESKEISRHINTLKGDRQRKRNQLASGPTSARLRRSIEETIRFLDQEIVALQEALQEMLRADESTAQDLDLLLSIPAIGLTTACAFLAEVDVSRFPQASHLAAYAGLVPTEHSSGSSVHKKSRLSKVGDRHLRTLFFMPALSAHRFNPIIHRLKRRLEARGKQSMVIIGATMRKLLHLAYGVLKTRKPFDPNHTNPLPVAA